MSEMNIGVNVDTGEKVTINLEKFIDTRAILTASSGGGKSWSVRKFLQESYGKVQQIILDWEGEYSNLRSEFDYLLVGDEGEVPIEVKTAELLARKIMQLGVSTIIDLSDLTIHDRKLFTRNFLDSLLSLPKEMYDHSVLLFIDEAHLLCPQKGNSESMNSVINVNSTGRKRGIGTVLCTQRIAKLNKDAVAESRNGAMGGMGLLEDRKRACDEMGFNTRELEQSIKLLDTGVFYMYGPAVSKEVIKVKIGDVKVRPPKPGQRLVVNDKTPEAIKKILQSLTDIPKEAEKELKTKEDMKKKIAELKRELSRRPTETKVKEIVKVDEVALQRAKTQGAKETEIKYRKQSRDVEMIYKKKINEVDSFYKKGMRTSDIEISRLKQVLVKISNLTGIKGVATNPAPITNNEAKEAIDLNVQVPKIVMPELNTPHPISPTIPHNIPQVQSNNNHNEDYDPDAEIKLTLCAKKVYSFLFENSEKTFSMIQITWATGYRMGGGFMNNVYLLTNAGLAIKEGSTLRIGEINPEYSTEKVIKFTIEDIYAKLPKCAENVLRLLYEDPDREWTAQELADNAGDGYAMGGGFMNNVYKLTGLELAKKYGQNIKLNPEVLDLE